MKCYVLGLGYETFIFNTLYILAIVYGCESYTYRIHGETWHKIQQIQKHFITYHFRIKCNAHSLIISIEVRYTF